MRCGAQPDIRGPILLSAYQCGPGMGSVSQIGWEWYRRLARRVPLTLVTHIRNRAALVAAGAPLAESEILYVDTEWFARPLFLLARRIFPNSEHAVFLLSSLDFFLFEFMARRALRRRQARGQSWELVHVVTPVSPAAVTGLHALRMPLIRGPLNGHVATPSGFPDLMREDSAWLYPLRSLGYAWDWARGASRRAARILVATRATRHALPPSLRKEAIAMPENGVDPTVFRVAPWPLPPSPTEPLRLLFVGRLIPCKALSLLLEAVARCRQIPIRLRVVGDGPMRAPWEQRMRELHVEDRVVFVGARSQAEVAEELRETHVFCLPSVRESGGAVLLEAMAVGRPVVAVDWGGPAELVDDEVGRLVPAHDSETVVEGLAETFRSVAADPEAWRLRGLAGQKRAEARYTWEAKIDHALRLYGEVLAV